MKKAASYILGTHDFRNLCKMDVGNGVVNYVREVKSINITSLSPDQEEDNTRKDLQFHSHRVTTHFDFKLFMPSDLM